MIAIWQPGIEIAGTLPKELGTTTTFAAGSASGSTEPDVARQLLAWLKSSAFAAVFKKRGFLEPQ